MKSVIDCFAVLVAFLAVVAVADGGDLRAVTRKVIRL